MRRHSSLQKAFAVEAIIGFLALLSIFFLSEVGVSLVFFFLFWPFLFPRNQASTHEQGRKIYSDTLKISLGVTAFIVFLTYLAFETAIVTPQSPYLIFMLIFPWFMVSHGLVGFFVSESRADASSFP